MGWALKSMEWEPSGTEIKGNRKQISRDCGKLCSRAVFQPALTAPRPANGLRPTAAQQLPHLYPSGRGMPQGGRSRP